MLKKCGNPYTKRNIDKLEAVQRRAARFALNFYDYHPTGDLSGKIQKSLQWDSFQHHRAVADVCMFYKLRNNLANNSIPPILVPSVKHNCHYYHIKSLHSDAFRYQFHARGVRLWNIIPCHLATKPSLEFISHCNLPVDLTILLSFLCLFLFCCYLLFVIILLFAVRV